MRAAITIGCLRTISRRDMRKCVNDYTSIVLNEQPLDPTLVDFDDSDAY